MFPLWRDVPAGRPLTADERERRILIRSVRPPGLDSRRPGRQPSHPSADVGARRGPCADRLPRQSTDGVNHGKESSKFNWDCTICRTCRSTISDSTVLKQRNNGTKWRESRVVSGSHVSNRPARRSANRGLRSRHRQHVVG